MPDFSEGKNLTSINSRQLRKGVLCSSAWELMVLLLLEAVFPWFGEYNKVVFIGCFHGNVNLNIGTDTVRLSLLCCHDMALICNTHFSPRESQYTFC